METKEVVTLINNILGDHLLKPIDKLYFQTLRVTLSDSQLHSIYLNIISKILS